VFILDVSGSMDGFPLDTARTLIGKLLASLQPRDRFNILFFAGGSSVLAPQSLARDA
jgi:Ca-activated chloride channel family protein